MDGKPKEQNKMFYCTVALPCLYEIHELYWLNQVPFFKIQSLASKHPSADSHWLLVSTRNPKLTSIWGSIWGSNESITKWQYLNPQTAEYEGPESHQWLTDNDANMSTPKK